MTDVDLKIEGLDNLLKALRADRVPVGRIGILADAARISESGSVSTTNAQVGACHEFGTSKMPARSFLRVPLAEQLPARLEKAGMFTKETLAQVLKTGSLLPWVQKMCVIAEGVVQDAFDTGGFGKWQAWKNPAYQNNAGMLLVDTTQLRNSITSEVKA